MNRNTIRQRFNIALSDTATFKEQADQELAPWLTTHIYDWRELQPDTLGDKLKELRNKTPFILVNEFGTGEEVDIDFPGDETHVYNKIRFIGAEQYAAYNEYLEPQPETNPYITAPEVSQELTEMGYPKSRRHSQYEPIAERRKVQ